jgi:predicted exporter
VRGAGEWSNKANVVFGGKMNIAGALMLADTPEQVPLLKKAILDNDARDPQGTMIAEITTIESYLPGTPEEQARKLEVLDRNRERLSPRVLADAAPDERATLLRMKPPESLHVLGARDLPPLLARRFTENDGRVGTVLYVKPKNDVVFADAHNHLRLSQTTDNVRLPDGTVVMTASRSSIFAEMIRSMRRDGPLASIVAFSLVLVVVRAASRGLRQFVVVVVSLLVGVTWLLGVAAWFDFRVNYVNFIALPITLGIGCEYPFNIADRTRQLAWDASMAVRRSAGAVMLCSFTTIVGYGSLVLSDFQALASFGKLAVVGEIACIFSAIFLLPSLFHVLRAEPPI